MASPKRAITSSRCTASNAPSRAWPGCRQKRPPPDTSCQLLADVDEFVADAHQADDITALALTWHGRQDRNDAKSLWLTGCRRSSRHSTAPSETLTAARRCLPALRDDMRLVLEELMVNTVSYGYPGWTRWPDPPAVAHGARERQRTSRAGSTTPSHSTPLRPAAPDAERRYRRPRGSWRPGRASRTHAGQRDTLHAAICERQPGNCSASTTRARKDPAS